MVDSVAPPGETGATVSMAPSDPPTLLGASLDRYTVLQRLGRGGMGDVFAAYDQKLDRKVALKVLRHASEPYRQRLVREAQAMARLSHPNVVAIFDTGTVDGRFFLAMEFVRGVTLGVWQRAPGRSSKEVLRAYLDAGRGLAAAHAAGLVHRDFKPDNALVADSGEVKVTDFGIARAVGETSSERLDEGDSVTDVAARIRERGEVLTTPITEDGTLLGTPGYMAPEQYACEAVDERTDQFTFCVSLYEALYGEKPFAGPTFSAMVDAVLAGRVKDAPSGAKVPPRIRRVLLRGLSVERSTRYPSMTALLADLAADPWRRWRPALVAAGAASIVAVAVIGDRTLQRHQSLQCADAEAQLSGVWDGPRKAAVLSAFGAARAPGASDAFTRVAATLDDYARRWAAARQGACEATRVRGEQSEELLDLRMDCLDRRREELKELGELLGHADAELVGRGVQAAQSLTPLDRCANVVTLKAPLAPPPAERARVAELARGAARLHAMGAAGKWGDGLSAAKPLIDEARRIAYPPLLAELLYELGYLLSRKYQDKEAEAAFRESIVAATEGRADLVAAQSTAELVQTLGTGEQHFDDAVEWSKLGFAWLRRIGGDDLTEAKLHAMLGNLYEEKSDFVEARRHHATALALREKRLGPDSIEVMQTLVDSCAVALLEGKLEDAEVLGRRGWAIQERVAPHHPAVAITENALGDVLYARGRYDEALTLYRGALATAERDLGSEHYFVAISALHIGAVDTRVGAFDEARAMLDRGLRLQQTVWGADHEQVASAWAALGWLDLAQGRFAIAKERFERAVGAWKKTLGETHPDVAGGLAGLGIALEGLRKEGEAVAPLERAVTMGIVPLGMKADTLASLARVIASRDPERAPRLSREAAETYRAAGEATKVR
jgi:tetratricopeptide (TPR) repeat protein/predicted Ser/Thr protein kinase